MATKKTAVNKTMAKKAITPSVAPAKKTAAAKLPSTKMTKTQVIRHMAEQLQVPPKQVAGETILRRCER